MYCPTCGNEIAVELKYCNRCGANLTVPATTQVVSMAPIKMGLPSIVLGGTVVFGLLIIIAGATQMSIAGMPAVATVGSVEAWVSTRSASGCSMPMTPVHRSP